MPGFNHDDVESIFTYHPAVGVTASKHDRVREICKHAGHKLLDVMPPSPEATIAIRKLQEAMMFANAAIAIDGAS